MIDGFHIISAARDTVTWWVERDGTGRWVWDAAMIQNFDRTYVYCYLAWFLLLMGSIVSVKFWDKWITYLKDKGWMTFDKWAHCLLHVIIVRRLRSFGVFGWTAFLISACFGLVYEVFDYCFNTKNIKDSLQDIVANTIGALVGLII